MRTLFFIPLVLMSLVSFPSWGLTMDDLVYREGLYYEKFTATPFTGEVDEGLIRVTIKNGKMQGDFETYHDNGQLMEKSYVVNNNLEGFYKRYYPNGELLEKGNYKDGKKEGYWESYDKHGSVWEVFSGTYKNDVKVSD
jgi:antitoxin component YwqK of YwqJK toxin-antitoxin module